jgi:hypothetical protein
MRYTDVKILAIAHYSAGKTQPAIILTSSPGTGKTSLGFDIAKEMGYTDDQITLFRPSLRDPVDLLGAPDIRGETMRWKMPDELARLQTGKHFLIIDEINDSVLMMQNALCGLLLDRRVGELKLSDDVKIFCTGNRVEDKSGAQRIITKLSNRVMKLDLDVHLDDWIEWAFDNNVPITQISFMRFRPGLLNAFDPMKQSNPTPRSWDFVSKIPSALPQFLYHEAVKGYVGEGAAAEYVGFRAIAEKLPDPDEVLEDPNKAEVPNDPATLYALTGALCERIKPDTHEVKFPQLCAYIKRIPAEFQVLALRDAYKFCPAIGVSKQFTDWANKNSKVLMG